MNYQTVQFFGVPDFFEAGVDVVVKCLVPTNQNFYMPDSVALCRSGFTDVNSCDMLSMINRKTVVDNVATVTFAWNDICDKLMWNQEYVFMYINSSTHTPVALSRVFNFKQKNQMQYGDNASAGLNSQQIPVSNQMANQMSNQMYSANQMPVRSQMQMGSQNSMTNQMVATQMANRMPTNQVVASNPMLMANQLPGANQVVRNRMSGNGMAMANQMSWANQAGGNQMVVQGQNGLMSNVTSKFHAAKAKMTEYVNHAVGNPDHPHHGILSTLMTIFQTVKKTVLDVWQHIKSFFGGDDEHEELCSKLFSKVHGAHGSAAQAKSLTSDSSPSGQQSHYSFLDDMKSKLSSAKKVAGQLMSKIAKTGAKAVEFGASALKAGTQKAKSAIESGVSSMKSGSGAIKGGINGLKGKMSGVFSKLYNAEGLAGVLGNVGELAILA